jgi:hypothetical protein
VFFVSSSDSIFCSHGPSALWRFRTATSLHQTMKAFLPIFLRFAFIVFFASVVIAESLRS